MANHWREVANLCVRAPECGTQMYLETLQHDQSRCDEEESCMSWYAEEEGSPENERLHLRVCSIEGLEFMLLGTLVYHIRHKPWIDQAFAGSTECCWSLHRMNPEPDDQSSAEHEIAAICESGDHSLHFHI